jgi:hypothetical protein
MLPQTLFFDFIKTSLDHGARLQRRQLELLMAMQIRLAEAQMKQVMNFWNRMFLR